jgi:hypothetical protein
VGSGIACGGIGNCWPLDAKFAGAEGVAPRVVIIPESVALGTPAGGTEGTAATADAFSDAALPRSAATAGG